MNARVRTRVSAYAIVAQGDRLLLARLTDASPIFTPGLWHLPGGGIDPGEQPVEALTREVREETGLELTAAPRLLDARTYSVRRHGADWNLTALFYMAEVEAGMPTVAEIDGSTDTAVWMPISDLRDAVLSPPASYALRILRSEVPGSRGRDV